MTATRVYRASRVITMAGPALVEGWVAVEGDRIRAVGDGPSPAGEIEEIRGGIILPGFVNAHSHLGCSFLESRVLDRGFVDWLSGAVTPLLIDAYLGPVAAEEREHVVAEAARAARAMRAGGTTTVVDSFFDAVGYDTLGDAGLSGTFCREYFGSNSDDFNDYVRQMRSRTAADLERFTAPGRRFGLAPHALYSCPRDVLVEVFGCARDHGLPITIHVAESAEERAFFEEGSGPMRELFAPGEKKERYDFGKSPVATMAELGLLGPDVLLVHMVHVDDHDLDLVAASGAGVVHCPGSNAFLATGAAPVSDMIERGIPVALGTDSLASNFSVDMRDEMRRALAVHRLRSGTPSGLDAWHLLRMSTVDGARLAGLGDETGTLETGKKADLSLFVCEEDGLPEDLDDLAAVILGSRCHSAGVVAAGRRFDDRCR